MEADELNPYESPRSLDDPAQNAIPFEPEDQTPPNLDDPVTIATYAYPGEADLKRMLLDQHGIQSLIMDGEVMNLSWFLSNAMGGVKLVVARRDAQRALQLFEEHENISEARARVAQTLPPITFRCEGCDAEISFPGHRRGKVETCPACREYVDVPE